MESETDHQFEKLIQQARTELPFGEAREVGFETRLRQSISDRGEAGLTFEGFGRWCWRLSWVGCSILAVLSIISVAVVDTTELTGVLSACADYLLF